MTDRELLARGLCCNCGTGKTHHGPWSDSQLAESTADIGCTVADFIDVCDSCFVRDICHGDVKYATFLAGTRPLVLKGGAA